MRKLIFLILCYTVLYTILYPIEFNGEINNSLILRDYDKILLENSSKIKFNMKGEEFYSQVTLKGTCGITSSGIEIDRAYIEIYKKDLMFGIGKQRILWGVGYLFNYTDVFNEINITNPKEEKDGVNSLKLRYNLGKTTRIETIGVLKDEKTFDFGGRITFTFDKFEFMINYIRNKPDRINSEIKKITQNFSTELYEIKNEHFILEFKGEIEIGIWGELIYKINKNPEIPSNIPEKFKLQMPKFYDNEKIITLGFDYTFDIFGHNLYLLSEYSYNDTSYQTLGYFTYKFNIFDDLNFSENLLSDIKNGAYIFGNSLNYTFNDYIIITLNYNRYICKYKSNYLKNINNGIENEISTILKINF